MSPQKNVRDLSLQLVPMAAAARRLAQDGVFFQALAAEIARERLTGGGSGLEQRLRRVFPRLPAVFPDEAEPDGRGQVVADLLEVIDQHLQEQQRLAA